MLAQSMAEVFRSGPRGAAHDLRLLAADWELPFERISEQVGLWHGEADPEVTPAHARRLAGALPRCQLHLVPGAGHHLALSHADAVLEAVLAQRSAVD